MYNTFAIYHGAPGFTSKINSSRNIRWTGDVLKKGTSQKLT